MCFFVTYGCERMEGVKQRKLAAITFALPHRAYKLCLGAGVRHDRKGLDTLYSFIAILDFRRRLGTEFGGIKSR